jgi:hypothetical protein
MSDQKEKKPDRRDFIKAAGFAGLAIPVVSAITSGCEKDDDTESCECGDPDAGLDQTDLTALWNTQGYFVHENVDVSRWEQGEISAKINGVWSTFSNRKLSSGFIDWNFAARLDVILNPMGTMCLDGPHSGALATYGLTRGDSRFSLNCAFKGFGFVPLASEIDGVIDTVMTNWNASMPDKLVILEEFYTNKDLWDYRLLDSIELYSTPNFCTHSFLNQMENPIATICWLAIPGSFEVRAIARLIHPQDPDISEDDFKRVRWVDMIHDFYHGGPTPDPENPTRLAVLYYIVEEFDNSPAPGLMGLRTVPPL